MVNRCGLIVLLALSFARGILAQECPTISVDCPYPYPSDNTSITCKAQVSGSGKPSFKWMVSAGKITTGQGTSSITVVGAFGGLTATVAVGGLPDGCPNEASGSIIIEHLPKARKFDEYGDEVIPLAPTQPRRQTRRRRQWRTKTPNSISNRS